MNRPYRGRYRGPRRLSRGHGYGRLPNNLPYPLEFYEEYEEIEEEVIQNYNFTGENSTNYHQETLDLSAKIKAIRAENEADTKILVSNIHQEVSESEIHKLFSEFGALKRATLHYDKNGRSQGSAEVIFKNKDDARHAMTKYNGVPLDGLPLKIQLAISNVSTPITSRLNLNVPRLIPYNLRGRRGGLVQEVNRYEYRGRRFTRGYGRPRTRGFRGRFQHQNVSRTKEELDLELEDMANKSKITNFS